MEQLILDLALAKRIEHTEAEAAVSGAETMARLMPAANAAVERIAGGYAIYAGPDSPVSQAVGLGLDGPVSETEFLRLEDFYRNRKEPVRVETCPLADPSLFEHFGKNCYRATEFSNVMARKLRPSETFPQTSGATTVERVPHDGVDAWNLTVAQGFAGNQSVKQDILNVMKMFALAEGNECYLARVEGKLAGGATLSLRKGVAGLFGASTLPAFRNRGVQTALLTTRLARAVESGCDLAACLAQPGSSSNRNVIRQGFFVQYT